MSVKRRDLVKHRENHGYYLLRKGGNHTIYTNEKLVVPVKRTAKWIASRQMKYANRLRSRQSFNPSSLRIPSKILINPAGLPFF